MKRRVRKEQTRSHTASERFTVFFCAIILSASLSSFVSTVTEANPDPIVWVDSSGNNCWGNTPCEETVRLGINGVDSGGTVYIYEGDYPEDTITIDRHVSLIGLNGSEVTKVGDDGGMTTSHTMQINENLFVNISGLMIRNIFNGARWGINSSSNTVLRVSDCIFQNLYYGIYIADGYLDADSNYFNVTAENGYQPASIFVTGGSTDSIIVNNTFEFKNWHGVGVRIDGTAIRLIANNTFNQSFKGNEPNMGDKSGNVVLSNWGFTIGHTL